MAARGFNGGKTLNRICFEDPGTVAMLERTAEAIDEMAALKLVTMLEPFISVREDGQVKNLLDPDNGTAGPD